MRIFAIPTSTGSGGGASANGFGIIQPDNGTSPAASSPNDTAIFTSSDGSVTITGNAGTKTINFQATGASGTTMSLAAPGFPEIGISLSPIRSGQTFIISKSVQSAQTAWMGPVGGGATFPIFRFPQFNDFTGIMSGTQLPAPIGITLGGTGATIANTGFNNLSPMTTAGDLPYFSLIAGGATRLPAGGTGTVLAMTPSLIPYWDPGTQVVGIPFIMDGGSLAISTGIKGDIEIPFTCMINRVTLVSGQTGVLAIDIWRQTYASYPATVSQSIVASTPPTITDGIKYQDSTLTSWTLIINAGDMLRYNVNTCSLIIKANCQLKATKL